MTEDGLTRGGRVTVTDMSTPAPEDPWRPVSEQELVERAVDYPGLDTSPLSAREREDLRRRMNAPGGTKQRMILRERLEWARMGIIRTPQRVAQEEALVRAAPSKNDGYEEHDRAVVEWAPGRRYDPYEQGILAAIEWATGRRAKAPLSESTTSGSLPTNGEMCDEASLGTEIASGHHESLRTVRYPTNYRSYGVGVETTLLWLTGRSEDPPLGD